MKNVMRYAALAFAAMLLLTACSTSPAAGQIDAQQLADDLLDRVTFGEELTPLDEGAVERAYRLDPEKMTAAAAYYGTGATVDEICVIEAADEQAAAELMQTLQERLDTRKTEYADYKPEEVPKLDGAILEKSGSMVILCVTADIDTARDVIDGAKAA